MDLPLFLQVLDSASQTLGPQPSIQGPCSPFLFLLLSLFCPSKETGGVWASPVPPWPPTLTVYTHPGPTVAFLHQLPLQSADSWAQTCPWSCTSQCIILVFPLLSGSINSYHSGPIETFLFLRSQIQAISKHCRLLILLFLAPRPSLSYCWLSSGPHFQKQTKQTQKQCNGHRLFSLL